MIEFQTGQLRILAVDDEESILDLYREVLSPESNKDQKMLSEIGALADELFGERMTNAQPLSFDLLLCRQGDEAVEAVRTSLEEQRPFAVVFLDVRMPPGPDGVWTAQQIRALDPSIIIVIVTGYSDVHPKDIAHSVPPPHKLFYIQKPFHPQEIYQLAFGLSASWHAEYELRKMQYELENRVAKRTTELTRTNEELQREITERKLAEKGLRQLAKAVETMQLGVTITDLKGKIVYTNPAEAEMHGYRAEELPGRDLGIFAPPELRKPMPLEQVKEMKNWIRESLNIREDGSIFPVRLISDAVEDAEGTPIAVVTICEDITERKRIEEELKVYRNHLEELVKARTAELSRANEMLQREISEHKQAEKALQESEQWLAATLNSIGDAVVATDQKGKVIFMNPVAKALTGWKQKEALGREIAFDIVDEETRVPVENPAQMALRKDIVVALTPHSLLVARDGTETPIECKGAPIKDNTGNVTGIVMAFKDITQRRQAEEKLQKYREHLEELVEERTAKLTQSNEQLQQEITERRRAEEKQKTLLSIIEHNRDLIGIASLEGNLLYLNQAGLDLFGIESLEEIKGTRVFDYLPEEEFGKFEDAVSSVMQTQHWRGEMILKHPKDHHLTFSEMNCFLINDLETGQPVIAGVSRDLTARKESEERERELEEQLRQAQKLEAIGTLAGGIAHDFNNILGTILGYTDMLLRTSSAGSPEQENLKRVYRAGERAAELVQQILTFSRSGEGTLNPLYIPPIIKEALKMMRATIPTTITIRQNIDLNCHPILANATQIHQVIVNLCTNASHAMRETGGTLDVRLQEIDSPHAQEALPNVPEGTYLKLIVSDTGEGMPEEVRERIFEPFFTTKEAGKGTGLGLSVVHGIIKNHRGLITVDSAAGQGTTFCILFPVVEEEVRADTVEESLAIRGREHILVVDDDLDLVRLYEMGLSELGYHVTACNGSYEAREAFRAHPDQFDLVFTDQTMPFKTGVQLARELLQIRPEIPVILATGYSDSVSEEEAEALGIRQFLLKPVKVNRLAHNIRMILGPNEIVAEDDSSLSLKHEGRVGQEPLILPPKEQLVALHELLMLGDLDDFCEQAEQIEAGDAKYTPFVQKICRLAHELRMNELRQFIEQSMEETP